MKLIKYGEPGCLKTEIEAEEKFVRFAFDQFKPRHLGHYAELYDDNGKMIAVANFGVRQTF